MDTFKAPHEMSEAELFKKKFPGQGVPRQSDFLRKRMQGKGGAKYFDSGDYNMAKSKTKNANVVTGKAIPTPDTLPQRKTSSTKQSNLLEGTSPPPMNATAEERASVQEVASSDEQKTKQLITESDTTATNTSN